MVPIANARRGSRVRSDYFRPPNPLVPVTGGTLVEGSGFARGRGIAAARAALADGAGAALGGGVTSSTVGAIGSAVATGSVVTGVAGVDPAGVDSVTCGSLPWCL